MRIATLISCALLASNVSAHAQGYDWSGAYVGASVGGAWADTGVSTELTNFWDFPSDQVDRDALLPLLNGRLNGENVFGGVALGYNLQQSDLVYGVEADVSFLNVDDSRTAFNVPGIPAPQPYRIDTAAQVDWLTTFRGRIGWAFDRSLIYVTGGLAVGRHEFSQHISQLVLPAGFGTFDQQAAFQKTSWGWALGGGFEQALSERWSLKLQYLHVDLGSHRVQSFGKCASLPGVCEVYSGSHKVDVKLDTVSASINYRF